MPPAGMPRPDSEIYESFIVSLENELDLAAQLDPNPGRTFTFHRLNRTEYQRVIHDLLDFEGIDMELLLPADDVSYGFDNIGGVLKLPPTLLERYLSAARKISRNAVGDLEVPIDGATYRLKDDLPQREYLEGLPFGTRGGISVRHYFPVNGEYEFRAKLEGATAAAIALLPHELEFSIDGERVSVSSIKGDNAALVGGDYAGGTEFVEVRVPVQAGLRTIAVSFLKITSAEFEDLIQIYARPQPMKPLLPLVRNFTVTGPFNPVAGGQTPSQERIFECRPVTATDELPCAKRIMSTLARYAYRRPVSVGDIETLMTFYAVGREEGSFETGIARAIERLLVSPEFLFRIERDPENSQPGTPFQINDLELASRLSFFLWSSIPDDELLKLAVEGSLKDPAELSRQVVRMLNSPKAEAFVKNFSGQWLQLRNLDAKQPQEIRFPNWDDNLRQSFRRETELLFQSVLLEDRSALELLSADFTFVNERLAEHYNIPNVHGTRFRRVTLRDEARRGLLGHGSVLTVTSRSTRTSPVIRGKWVLEKLLGTPPPPPPPNVENLIEKNDAGEALSMREALSRHRASPGCASCHSQMDPLGFALENFNAVGQWRDKSEANTPIDTSAVLPNGTVFNGVNGLRDVLLSKPEQFVINLTETLMVYALGRGVEYYDMPALRKIVRDSSDEGYKLSSLVLGIIQSVPFQMRSVQQ